MFLVCEGIIKDYVTHPPTKLSFQIPTLIVASGVSSQAGTFGPPCASINVSNHRFYEVLTGPVHNFFEYFLC